MNPETTSSKNGSQEKLEDINQKDLEAFRKFFDIEILQDRKVPTIGSQSGKEININVVTKMGASTNEDLYLKYQENLLRIIALAFKILPKDLNIQEHDNRAMDAVSAEASFVVKIRASSDESLYLNHQENLLRIIILAFKILPKDFSYELPALTALKGG